jgi:phosphoglycerate dehydrogenase-like enzyme
MNASVSPTGTAPSAAEVLVLRPEADFARVGALPPAGLDVAYTGPADPELKARIAAAKALVIPAVGPKLAPELFDGARLSLVQVTGAGLDRLDKAAMQGFGIPVANVPGGSNAALAEYAVSTALVMLRRFSWGHAEIRAGRYVESRAKQLSENLGGLGGLTVGVIGFGVIGAAVAAAFHRMGSRIVFYDPAPADPSAAAALGAEAMPLDRLLAESDVVTLHVPLLPATTGLIGARELASMKKTAVLIQAARGGIVDEAALAAALEAGDIAGAAVDVYSVEPPPADNPLLAIGEAGAARLLLTPHIAGVTRQSAATLFKASWENVERVLAGDAPKYRVY